MQNIKKTKSFKMAGNQENTVSDMSAVLRFYQHQANQQQQNQNEEEDDHDSAMNEEIERQSNELVDRGINLINSIRRESLTSISSNDDDDAAVYKWDVEVFVNVMEGYPALWNTSARTHHKQDMRKSSWEELSKKFGKPVEFLKSQWKNLRENLKRCLVKRTKLTRSGAAYHTLPKCKYFNQLTYLQEKITNKDTESNVALQSPPPVDASMNAREDEMSNVLSSPDSDFTVTSKSPSPMTTGQKRKIADGNLARNKKMRDQTAAKIDMEVLQTLKQLNDATKNDNIESTPPDSEDMLFCKSIVPTLEKLTPRSNKLAKMRIQQILFELEFDESAP